MECNSKSRKSSFIPALMLSDKSEVTTVEGILDRSIQGLKQDQESRWKDHPETAGQIDEFLGKLQELKDVKLPFQIIFEDISGNCFVQNPNAPQVDHEVKIVHFARNKDQDHQLGIYSALEVNEENTQANSGNKDGLLQPIRDGEFPLENFEGEVLQFPTNCPSCRSPCTTNMKVTNIPHFKEVVIMATNCDFCGERTNEVKSGGGIEPQGLHIEVKVTSKEDLCRDVLKSETCHLRVPEIDVEVGPAALGGRFSTVEGILTAMRDQIFQSDVMFNDSADQANIQRLQEFREKFDFILEGKQPVTLILDDPAGNSYIQSLSDPDPALQISHYDRSYEQNEELGLNDMKVEDY